MLFQIFQIFRGRLTSVHVCVSQSDMGLVHSIRSNVLNTTSVTTIPGTNGYIDRHYEHTGRYDVMCDTYSMGVTILVTLTDWSVVDTVVRHIVERYYVEEDSDVRSISGLRQADTVVRCSGNRTSHGSFGNEQVPVHDCACLLRHICALMTHPTQQSNPTCPH